LKIKETPEGVNNKAVAFYLFGKANNLGEAADSALKMISEIKKKQPAFAMSYYNMGRILTELGRTASANESFNQFLNMEKTGLYADAARKTLKIETENQAIKSARMESPVKLGNATFSKEQLKKMKAKTVKIVDFDGTIYDGDNLKILVISDGKDDIVEMVEQTVEPRQFKMPTERPVRRVVTNMGETLLYENFAVDVVDNQVRKVVYFMSEM
jgi:tetratricopeptide (TPR) repeat protein